MKEGVGCLAGTLLLLGVLTLNPAILITAVLYIVMAGAVLAFLDNF